MIKQQFHHVTTWVFDLDNTLYPPRYRLFDQIEVRMTNWVMSALNVDRAHADHLRAHYWKSYGTTLAGLMAEHAIDPEPYLADVHDIDFSVLTPDPALAARIRAGIIWINNHNQSDANLPWGGFKQSGWGREAGVYGVEEYTQVKSVHVEIGKRNHWIK